MKKPNVCVFNASMSQPAIQADLDAISAQQVPIGSQFGSQRYSLFLETGTYGSAADPLVFQVGYYTQVAGLGAMPQDTVIDGAIDSAEIWAASQAAPIRRAIIDGNVVAQDYCASNTTLGVTEAFQAPLAPGVQFTNTFGVWISGSGGLDSIVNGTGGPVTSTSPGTVEPIDVPSYTG